VGAAVLRLAAPPDIDANPDTQDGATVVVVPHTPLQEMHDEA